MLKNIILSLSISKWPIVLKEKIVGYLQDQKFLCLLKS